ncbi:MAG: putative biosynthesis related phosphoenolpyruvate decarboxylase [Patescibacteria group bacterium]|nr:putative biosynthesis related phosphoenolpyruvate decarboxylase [Patescibacteria group bacterium]
MAQSLAGKLSPKELYESLLGAGVTFFTGVPDSLLSSFGFYLQDHAGRHIIAANEGNAVGLAIGHYAATTELPLVYMQNSGLTNAMNPLVSLAGPSVMSIPMILMIGWRGEPGTRDEPQHTKLGSITTALLDDLDIPYVILAGSASKAIEQIESMVRTARDGQRAVAILVRAGTLASYAPRSHPKNSYELAREAAITTVLDQLTPYDIVISTTGKASREVAEYIRSDGEPGPPSLLVVGAMGHASSIALAVALDRASQRVICLDGDGAAIMHLGALTTIGTSEANNLCHIVLNNGSHESVGGQPTAGFAVNLVEIARACGYAKSISVENGEQLTQAIKSTQDVACPTFIEVRIAQGSRSDLGRPTESPAENKQRFMNNLKDQSL